MASPVLGIDLGTTNSVVAASVDGRVQVLADAAGNKLFPSVVSFHPSGDVLAGYAARERRLVDAPNTIYSVKRLIGRSFKSEEVRRATSRLPFAFEEGPTGGALVVARGETYTLPEISAFVLRGVRALAEDALKTACKRAVITVPANFSELQRSATKAAGRVAGLDVLRILNEPTAAALAYGCGGSKTRERIAVYDLGGGTFDLTILELAGDVFEVIATAGDTFLGGDDIDVIVADELASAFLAQTRYDARNDNQAYERLRAAAEWAKCQLTEKPDVDLTVEDLGYGEGGAHLTLHFNLARQRLEALCRPLIARSFDVCEEAMRIAGVRPTQLDQVILVGGGTRMPIVRAMVAEYFGRAPLADLDPDFMVAQGAAIQGAALAGAPENEPVPASAAIGRVALKRVAAPAPGAAKVSEVRVPAGPAFQPRREPPPVPVVARARQLASLDDLPVPEVHTESEGTVAEPDAIALPQEGAPLLLDVTPQTLRIETVAGFTEVVIERNAAIPVEQSRVFTTSQDFQESVRATVCQGESRKLSENEELGVLELLGLPPVPRGKAKIEVTFLIDADGTLQVKARDLQTGAEQRIRINLVGAVGDEDIVRMQLRQQALVG